MVTAHTGIKRHVTFPGRQGHDPPTKITLPATRTQHLFVLPRLEAFSPDLRHRRALALALLLLQMKVW
jgi:hypothetical protein